MNLLRQTAALAALALSCLLLAGCPSSKDIAAELRTNLQSPSGEPHILAAYQPWFGRAGHINVGYSSQDRNVLERQISKAKELGISGFVVNWYGPSRDFEDRSYAMLQRVASGKDFQVALMYDESGDSPDESTNNAISDLNYAYDRYFGPHASVPRDAYMTINDRPVIFIFPKSGSTDWKKVRENMQGWDRQPVLIYKDANARVANQMDGFYAWVSPGQAGWTPDGSNWGRDYLDHFYATMTQQYPNKIAVGAAWPGFDDSRASWTQNRKMNSRCGKTMEDSLRVFRRYYDNDRPLPFLMVDTWNDYEEGTAIEGGLGCNGKTYPLTSSARNSGGPGR
ncbi:MAG: endo-1,3-alpha-glucanase family glycosylhydrolase [Acidobacteriaceae bacterium]